MIKPNNRMLVEFGQGDIVVASMLCSDGEGAAVGVLTLDNAVEPMDIGTAIPHDEEKDPFDVPVVLTFENIRSLDVVIDGLNAIRANMKAWEDGKFDIQYAGDETSE